ncbi:hypothetical protein [Zavarzinella formosa]|uniref:hypothetical protein n=1 Tax=Zavarzinella formosa TaxID=360055 RepID=UPI0012FAFFE9|nr:hypothetical protein [Zavarzinella formosa]
MKNQPVQEAKRNSSVDQRIETGLNRMALREQILINLRDEKITLEEAGRGFLAINQTDEAILRHLDTFFSGETDLERSTRQVVAQMRCSILPDSHECYLRLKSELETIQFPKTSNDGEIQIASRRGD